MEEDQILDADFRNRNLKLSNFQLIGIITEKARYPEHIISKVNREIIQRKISNEEIQTLKDRYQSFANVEQLKIRFNRFSIMFVFLLLFLSFLPFFFIGPSIFIFSILAIKAKFEKGIFAEQKIWKLFMLIYLCLFFLAIIIAWMM